MRDAQVSLVGCSYLTNNLVRILYISLTSLLRPFFQTMERDAQVSKRQVTEDLLSPMCDTSPDSTGSESQPLDTVYVASIRIRTILSRCLVSIPLGACSRLAVPSG